MGKSVGKNANQKLSDKYSHKLLDHAKQSAADTIKTPSKMAIQKESEGTGDLIDNKFTDKMTKSVARSVPMIVPSETEDMEFHDINQ